MGRGQRTAIQPMALQCRERGVAMCWSRSWRARGEQSTKLQAATEGEREQRQRPSSEEEGGLIITNIYTHVWTVGPRDRSYVDNSYFRQAYKSGFTFKMPILLFLLDTSASMNQRTYLGTTYLDIAKGAVEVFMKVKNDLTPTFFSQRAPLQSLGSSARLVGINICCFGFLLFLTAACPRPG